VKAKSTEKDLDAIISATPGRTVLRLSGFSLHAFQSPLDALDSLVPILRLVEFIVAPFISSELVVLAIAFGLHLVHSIGDFSLAYSITSKWVIDRRKSQRYSAGPPL